MAYLDRMGREGVRELVSDGEIATPEQLAERRARIEADRVRNAPVRQPALTETDISNEAELRANLRRAIAGRAEAQTGHERAVEALERGRNLQREATEAVATAAAEVERAGSDLADRIARWAAEGGDSPADLPDPEAHARHIAAQARAASADRACQALSATEMARRTALGEATLRVQQAVYRVVARDAEAIARRAEAMRAEADALVSGLSHIGAHFGPSAALGAPHQSATARVVGGGFLKVQAASVETTLTRRMREAWGAYVAALATDADARLTLPEMAPE
ncbi:MAG: hypothetical protein MIL41_04795 [Hyphomicrobiales bacterium]|jgi:hypothetical protein